MTSAELLPLRLHNQRVFRTTFTEPADAVRWLGAVQAQEYGSARWAVAQRTRAATEPDLDAALASGSIIRTHVLRPTWHFVAADDLRWLLALSGPRVLAACATYFRNLELDAQVFARSAKVFARELAGGRQLTRTALRDALRRAKVIGDAESSIRLAFIVMHAELTGLICSGPRQGKQFTYALVDDRVPAAAPMPRDAARAELVRRFFVSHGPATAQDFSWWSGLTVGDARAGLEDVKADLVEHTVDGRSYWMPPPRGAVSTGACLLAAYDEGLLAYRDNRPALAPYGPQLTLDNGHAVIVSGRVAGTWGRSVARRRIGIAVRPFGRLSSKEKDAVAQVGERYARFAGVPVDVVFG